MSLVHVLKHLVTECLLTSKTNILEVNGGEIIHVYVLVDSYTCYSFIFFHKYLQ